MLKRIILPAIILISILNSCQKPEPKPITIITDVAIVLNQGNFTDKSASISIYNENDGTLINNAYSIVNGVDLGATIMSGTIHGDYLYILLSDPDKALKLDLMSLELKQDNCLSDLSNPRVIYSDENYIYVSNYGTTTVELAPNWDEYTESYVNVYNASTLSKVGSVVVGSDVEGMASIGNKLYVAVKQGIAVVDMSSGTPVLTTTIKDTNLGGAKYFITGKDNTLYASFPDYGLGIINTSTNTISKKHEIPIDYDGYIAYSSEDNKIYSYTTTYSADWTSTTSEIFCFNVATESYSSFATGEYFYSIGVSPATNNIYTAEVGSFVVNSTMCVFDNTGASVDEQTVGVGAYRYLFVTVEEEIIL